MVNRPCRQFWSWKPWMPCSMQGRCHHHPQTRWPAGSLREISKGEPALCPRNEGIGAGQGIILKSHTITLGSCFYLHLFHLLAVNCNAIHHFKNEKEIAAEIRPAIVSGIVIADAPVSYWSLKKTRRKLGRVNFCKDFWDGCWGQGKKLATSWPACP